MSARSFSGPGSAAVLLCLLSAGCAPAVHHPSDNAGSDSVSVGYGMQQKRAVSTAIGSVTPSETDAAGAMTLEQLIEGKVAGVEVLRSGGVISLRIRGTSSFNASNEPLYVIDGMRVNARSFTDAMSGINPHDVARIDVLKDAAATAIYGTDGANGVVVVTTKRPK